MNNSSNPSSLSSKTDSRMKRILILSIGVLLFFGPSGYAQERRWTLEECIAHAYMQNIEIKTQDPAAAA